MKSLIKQNGALIAALIIICSVCMLFFSRKEGMFIDEIYSFGLANSYYAPYVTDLKGGDMTDTVFSREELLDYLSVGEDDAFAAGSVYYNQTRDVHPPLYYWLLNLASSLCAGHFSMWIGLILNLVIYLAALIVLYRLALLLFDSRLCAVAAVLLYGLSTLALSTVLMIRMYMLLTLFTLLLAYLIARLVKGGGKRLLPLVTLTVFAGLMTQYYFVFYAFFVCAAYDVHLLIKRDWRAFAAFSCTAVLGVAALPLAFPACLEQLFADALVSGGNAVDNLMSVWQYADRLSTFVAESAHRMKAIIYIGVAALVGAAASIKGFKQANCEGKGFAPAALILVVPALLSFVVIAIISPVVEIRYIYNIVPISVIAVCMLLRFIELGSAKLFSVRWTKPLMGAVIAAVCLLQARAVAPDYLYDEYSDYDALLRAHSDAPCVYIDDNYFSPITYDLLQLMNFDDFLVTNDTRSAAMLDYIGSAEETVVFIDISKQWASGYDADEVISALEESTGFADAQALYSNGFSAAYLLKNRG